MLNTLATQIVAVSLQLIVGTSNKIQTVFEDSKIRSHRFYNYFSILTYSKEIKFNHLPGQNLII